MKAGYGLEIALLLGLACLALAAHGPDRPGAGVLLASGVLLLAGGGAALLALRGTGFTGELFRRATRRLRTLPRA